MKEYNVYFSYYSKDYGLFCDKKYSIQSENQFEARKNAWNYAEADAETKNVANLKQIGVTWKSTPLEIQDYFNSRAAQIKLEINQIKNVSIPQDNLDNRADLTDRYNYLSECYGRLYELDEIAEELYKGMGIIPPSIYDETIYADLISQELYNSNKHTEADSLSNIVSEATNWGTNEKYTLKQLFEKGYYYNYGEIHLEHFFHKDSVVPEKSSLNEEYISKPRNIEKLYQLPMYTKNDIHSESGEMNYQDQVLVLNSEKLRKENIKPEQLLWLAIEGLGCDPTSKESIIKAKNLITGQKTKWYRNDFLGVLSYEKSNVIEFDKLNHEYIEKQKSKLKKKFAEVTSEKYWENEL